MEDKIKVIGYTKPGLSSLKTGAFSMYNIGASVGTSYTGMQPPSPTFSRAWSSRSSTSQASIQSPKIIVATTSTGEVKRLTERELQEKRAKGLCYRCDVKWMVGHRCAR